MKRLLFLALLFPIIAMAAGETSSPNMGLVIPGVGTTAGPAWATDLNTSLGLIDAHDHSPGNGVQVTPAGININSDLGFNNTNVSLPRSIRYTSQSAPISGTNDVSASYVSGVDLYFNDGNGNQIRITQSGSVAGSAGTITGLPSGTASAAFSSGQGTFIFQQATSTAANMDIGSLILRYPGSYPSPSGNYIALEAPASLATGYAFTLPNSTPAANQSALVSDTSGTLSYLTPNGIANARTRATGTSVAAGGVAISASSSNFFTSSGTITSVTNLSVTIVTTGRPVMVMLIPDGTSSFSRIFVDSTTGGAQGTFYLNRDSGAARSIGYLGGTGGGAGSYNQFVPPGAISWIDLPSAASHTYVAQVEADTGTGTEIGVFYSKLVAYEL